MSRAFLGHVRALLGHVEEPATLLTDLVLAAFGAYWAVALLGAGAHRGDAGVPTTVWGGGFAATALAAALGGVVHGFQHRMGRHGPALWRATLHLITLGSAAMLAAAVLVFAPAPLRLVGLAAVVLKLAAATALLYRDPAFRTALADHAMALAGVLALQLAAYFSYGAPSAPWVAAGVVVSALSGAVQVLRIAPHPRFNHNDLYHVVQLGALWLLYRGGLLLGTG